MTGCRGGVQYMPRNAATRPFTLPWAADGSPSKVRLPLVMVAMVAALVLNGVVVTTAEAALGKGVAFGSRARSDVSLGGTTSLSPAAINQGQGFSFTIDYHEFSLTTHAPWTTPDCPGLQTVPDFIDSLTTLRFVSGQTIPAIGQSVIQAHSNAYACDEERADMTIAQWRTKKYTGSVPGSSTSGLLPGCYAIDPMEANSAPGWDAVLSVGGAACGKKDSDKDGLPDTVE